MNSSEIIARVRGGVFTHSGPFAAGRHYGVCWSSRMQTVGEHGCNLLVSGNANGWSGPYNYAP